MTELTTPILDDTMPDQSGTTKPVFWALDVLTVLELEIPAEVEPIGPCEADAQWWAEQNEDEAEDEPAMEPSEADVDRYEEMLDALAFEASYYDTLEALGYSRLTRPLTDADLAANGGCVG